MKDWLTKVLYLGPLDSWKTILAFILPIMTKYVPGFPVLDLGHGITADQVLLALAALKKVLEKFKK